MESHNKNITLVNDKLLSVIKRINKLVEEVPERADLLSEMFELSTEHAKKLMYIEETLKEANKLSDEKQNESIFKDYILDANEFCNEANSLLSKHFN